MNLAEFLLARIADDEERAQLVWSQYSDHAKAYPWEQWRLSWQDEYDLLCIEPPRALAECEAKRRILGSHTEAKLMGYESEPGCCDECDGAPDFPCVTVRFLALPYADHPDYRQEWKP